MIEKLSSVYMKAVLIQLYNPDSSMLYVICMLIGMQKNKTCEFIGNSFFLIFFCGGGGGGS